MSGDQLPSLPGRKRHQMPRVCPWEGMLKLWFDWYITTIKIVNFCNIITDGPRAIWEEIVDVNETYVNVTLAFERCCVTKMWFTRVCVGTLRVCFKFLKSNVLWIKPTYLAFLSYSLLFHGVWGHFEAFTATSANSLKTLQNGDCLSSLLY